MTDPGCTKAARSTRRPTSPATRSASGAQRALYAAIWDVGAKGATQSTSAFWLLPELPGDEFGDDVEVSPDGGVLLDQMEQDGFEPPGSAPSQRGPGLPVSARSWALMTARPRSACTRSAATRWSSVSSSATYQRSPRLSPHGSVIGRPSKPHSSHRSSTYLRCWSNSTGVQPKVSRLCRSALSGNPSILLTTRERK